MWESMVMFSTEWSKFGKLFPLFHPKFSSCQKVLWIYCIYLWPTGMSFHNCTLIFIVTFYTDYCFCALENLKDFILPRDEFFWGLVLDWLFFMYECWWRLFFFFNDWNSDVNKTVLNFIFLHYDLNFLIILSQYLFFAFSLFLFMQCRCIMYWVLCAWSTST